MMFIIYNEKKIFLNKIIERISSDETSNVKRKKKSMKINLQNSAVDFDTIDLVHYSMNHQFVLHYYYLLNYL